VICYQYRYIIPLKPLAAHFGNAFLVSCEGAGGGSAQSTDGLGLDGGELPEKELAADLHLLRLGSAVSGWPALDDIADVNIAALQWNSFLFCGVLNHLRQQLAGAPDKRDTLGIFIRARAFADKDQRGLFVPHSEHDFVSLLMQAASVAIPDVLHDLEQSFAGGS
jgi:hypothetical protein